MPFMLAGLVSMSILLGPAVARTNELIEVPVSAVLIPEKGFDDNDHVQAVIVGELPHACYTLGQVKIEHDQKGTIRVRQSAWLRTTGVCATGDVPDQPVPFSGELSFGRLDAGNYEIAYRDESGPRTRGFHVAPAANSAIDDYAYAMVTGALLPPLRFYDEEVPVKLVGMIDTSCAKLGDRVRIERQKDVLVILPIQTPIAGATCRGRLSGFERTVNLGKLPAGQYLAHIRSASGQAVNRVFTVAK